jgi:hypothetical protein
MAFVLQSVSGGDVRLDMGDLTMGKGEVFVVIVHVRILVTAW